MQCVQRCSRKTHVNDDHLNLADDQNSVFKRLRDINVTVSHVDCLAPTAVNTFVAANVFLCVAIEIFYFFFLGK